MLRFMLSYIFNYVIFEPLYYQPWSVFLIFNLEKVCWVAKRRQKRQINISITTIGYFEPSMAYRKSIHQIGLNKRRSNGGLCISSISFWSFIYIVLNMKKCFSFFECSVTYSSAFLQKWKVWKIILEQRKPIWKLLWYENKVAACK